MVADGNALEMRILFAVVNVTARENNAPARGRTHKLMDGGLQTLESRNGVARRSMQRLVRCLDLFCGAGGAAMGLHRAGFEVVGVDEFRQGDAMEADLTGFDMVWASPPCQAYTEMQRMHKNQSAHRDLVGPMREKLEAWGGIWIMENVAGAPLRSHVMLCGSMFGLRIIKHRYFEANFQLPLLMPPCDHRDMYDPWHGKGRTATAMREAQGTPWIPCSGGASRKRGASGDLNNAIPPAYSDFLGRYALAAIHSANDSAHTQKGRERGPDNTQD